MKWDICSLDLDWSRKTSKPPEDGQPLNGYDELSNLFEAGWELLQVWYEPNGDGDGFARALLRRPSLMGLGETL